MKPDTYDEVIAQRDAARAEAARLRDLVDAARNILQSIVKSPCEAEIREWLRAVETKR